MTGTTENRKTTVLCILDGWGERAPAPDNAIASANTPVWDRLNDTTPKSTLEASESFVGLPAGQMGNSEVGHMNIGAGRVVNQDLPRIDAAITDGTLQDETGIRNFIAAMKASGGTAHVLGLMSDGGVHSHQRHIAALARILTDAGVPVAVHAFLDGRDTAPQSAADLVRQFEEEQAPGIQVATLCGRYWAMDRDNRWDRVSRAYDLLTAAKGERFDTAAAAIAASYANDVSDEFVEPYVIGDYAGMADGDGILMANFRADRAREILLSFLKDDFDGFDRSTVISFASVLGMVEYSDELAGMMGTIFPPVELEDVLGAVIANRGLRQLRIAETEKYAHVTFFLNGGREAVFEGEDRILVKSPDVPTYDIQPEMSAPEVTDRLVEAIESGRYDLIVVNYANTDMVGHTGNFDAAVKAVEAVDACVGRLESALQAAGGNLLITADHGNAERMRDDHTGGAHTAHTLSKVPFMLAVSNGISAAGLTDGSLCDIAPTVLDIMGLPLPAAMTGRSLLQYAAKDAAE
ncbi:MAG: 2,3-bisphosphoglycerate-independent phosphoglycerate mutase [Alphaproteobacteria bacterium]